MAVTVAQINKQMNKVVDVAKSVAGLSEMIQTQGAKATKLAADNKDGFDDDKTYTAFSKACQATDAAKTALFKEIKVLMDTCNDLGDLMDQVEKEMKPSKKK